MIIVFLLTHVPDPRMNKRIRMAKCFGEVIVICVRRASQDIWEPYYKDVIHEIINVDLPPARQIVKRIIASRTYKKEAFVFLQKYKPDMIYTEGLDSLGIVLKYKKKTQCRIIYEVADLRESFIEIPRSFTARVISFIIRRQEKKLFACVDNLVVTSEKFYDMHYSRLISKDRMIFMPNVPEQECFESYVKKDNGVFTVGFIGGIRYLKQMKMLVDAAECVGCNVLFAGAGGTSDDYKQIMEYCKDKNNVTFTGKYNYNKDIARLYGMVDCVYAVYDADNPNVKIALPNKLYEAVLCQLPIIVAKNTYLSQIVENWGVGISVNHNDMDDLVCGLKKLMNDVGFYASLTSACQTKKYEISNERYNAGLKSILYAK